MLDEIKKFKQDFSKFVEKQSSIEGIESAWQAFFGRKGHIQELFKNLIVLPSEKKKVIGKLLNDTKKELETFYKEKKVALQDLLDADKFKAYDFSLPVKNDYVGSLHPISLIQEQLEDIFYSMGFEILEGPHIENDFYNFEALNFPKDHPARDMQDTFYLPGDMLLRTQTSTIQIRAMEKMSPPLRIVGYGKVFRAERADASHSSVFHQIEGMMVDKEITVANMLYFIEIMLTEFFKEEIKMRLRPGYFPFVEPGFEVEIGCLVCASKGCPACKNLGWIEILGCGLVHPNVLKQGQIDSTIYSGFAFGLGIDRLAMMKYGINDIRLLNGGDLNFLRQFVSK